jgi:hypothetical protein
MSEATERGSKWWIRYVVVPIIKAIVYSSGITAVALAVIPYIFTTKPLIVGINTLGYSLAGGEGFSTGKAYKGSFPNNFECYSGTDCMKVQYSDQSQVNHRLDWSLIAWYPFSCEGVANANKADECITDLFISGNFKEIQRLTLWARGENGNEVVEFGVGGKNEVVEDRGFKYLKPQTQPASRVILTSNWKKYEIDLVDRDLTHVVPLFYVYYTFEDNPQGATFYLDDIQFEGH